MGLFSKIKNMFKGTSEEVIEKEEEINLNPEENPINQLGALNPINLNENNGTFATGIDYIKKEDVKEEEKKEEKTKEEEELNKMTVKKCPTFFEVHPPIYDPNELSLEIPVDIIKIKKNALNSIGKVKFMHFIKNEEINKLIDAMIKDSFWFIVCFFQFKNDRFLTLTHEEMSLQLKSSKNVRGESSKNISKTKSEISKNNAKDSKEKKDIFKKKSLLKPIKNRETLINAAKYENYRIVSEILVRLSKNYFQFFIRVCDFGMTRKNDPALNAFKDFMSHSVFYSIYLAFPKSRHLFIEEFRNRIVNFFTYLFNGLVSENNFHQMHWGLDLGKGNIIESGNKYQDEWKMELPSIAELQSLIDEILMRNKVKPNKSKKRGNEINTDILNTPLYRIYAENTKFVTLNLVKPIKMSNRKIIDIYKMNKIHAGYVKFAKDTLKAAAERKAQYKKEIEEKEAEFQLKINEVKANETRVKKELNDIKLQRVQEYANYCIFLSK